MFGRRNSPDVANTNNTNNTNNTATNGRHGHGLLHRNNEDPSIVNARERVLSAEAAERDADRALQAARVAVKDARNHIKLLERETAEE